MWDWRDEVYRLDDFIVGDANKNAYSMAKKFVEPSCGFHLLFVIGNVGNGKTYLAKAVEQELILQNRPVKMLNGDQFVGELIWYLSKDMENNGMDVFCKEFEEFDMLILDDLHFLEGKKMTQKYFAYLLACMTKNKKRVLLTSVKKWSEYQWLYDTLCKNPVQVEQVQIQDADKVLKKKILEELQQKWNYKISPESMDLIVESAKDIRQVEGMFKKMIAYKQFMNIEDVELEDIE